jgi:magnesium transporter
MMQQWNLEGGKVVPAADGPGVIQLFVNPTDAERKHLVEALAIDEHTLTSALDPDELARLEFEPEHLALILKRPRNYSSEERFVFNVTSVGLFLFSDRLVMVLPEDVPLFQGKLFTRLHTLLDVVLRVIYASTAHFIEHLKVVNAVSDSLEQQISTSMQNKYLLNLFSLEKSLVYYLNGINTNAKLIERLKINAAKIGFSPDNLEFIDDVIIENQQCYEQAEIYSNILASLMDARVSIVSNNLNWLMKTLTIITICIMLPNLVVSVFSMNVRFPGDEHPAAFWLILILALLSVVTVRIIWRWKKW